MVTTPHDDDALAEDAHSEDAGLDDGLKAAFGGGPADAEAGPPPSVLARWRADGRLVPQVLLREEPSDGGVPIRPATEAVGERAEGRYQVMGEIARGGVGVILKGHDLDLGRDVAMKVLRREQIGHVETEQRFVEEAQIGGQLQHPGIVPVYELGTRGDGRPYFTMKLVKGRTLGALLADREGPDDDRTRFVRIFHAVCETLAYAHARGVIHRDLKPANVMVGAFGEVLVVDWGLAKVMRQGGVEDERLPAPTRHDPTIVETVRSGGTGSESRVGSVMGTVRYMPPEQARGETERLDERADVFALGGILCEILTGEPPYTGEDHEIYEQVANARLEGAYERLDACDADDVLKDLVKRCLSPAPRGRPRHAGEVAQAVGAWISALESRAKEAAIAAARAEAEAKAERAVAETERERARTAHRARRLTQALAAALVLLVGGGVLAWHWMVQERDARLRTTAEGVHAALARAEALAERADEKEDLALWAEAKSALDRATDLVAEGETDAAIRARVAEVESDVAPKAEAAAKVQELFDRIKELKPQERHDEILALHREITEIWPEYAYGHSRLGSFLRACRRHEEGIAATRRAYELRPSLYYGSLASALSKSGDLRGALAIAEAAMQQSPESAHAWSALGIARSRAGDEYGAIEAYREVLRLDPTKTNMRVNLERVLRKAVMRGDERVLEGDLTPIDAAALLHLAGICDRCGRYLDAVRLYGLAFEASPHATTPLGPNACPRIWAVDSIGEALTKPDASGHRIDPEERSGLYEQARTWLREELANWTERLQTESSARALVGVGAVGYWWGYPSFATFKPDAVRRGDRPAWQAFWADWWRLRLDVSAQVAEGWTAECVEASDEPAVYVQLWKSLRRIGRFEEALASIRRADELKQGLPGWTVDSASMVTQSERDLALLERAPRMLAEGGEEPPAIDLAEAAELLLLQGRHDEALPLYERALAKDAGVLYANTAIRLHAYNAACVVLRASQDAERDDLAARRSRALGLLLTALGLREQQLEVATRFTAVERGWELERWREDPDLASVRGDAIDALPEPEREGWRRFWRGVDALIGMAARPR